MSEVTAPIGRYLAQVKYLKSEMPARFARLRPIYYVDDKPWRSLEGGDSEFLDEGLIFWWHPPSTVTENTLWIVTVEPSTSYGSDDRHRDKYQVQNAERPFQAVYLSGVTGARAFRRVLASGRLSFDVPVIGRPLIRVVGEGDHWVTLPESFVVTEQHGHSSLHVSGLEGVIAVFDIDADSFENVIVDGREYLLLLDLGIAKGYQCVASDAQLMEHLRKRISNIDRNVLVSLGVTKNLLRKYIDTLENAGLGGDDAEKEFARKDAAEELIEGIETEVSYLDDIAGILLENPRIADGLKAKTEEELQRRREEFELELIQEKKKAIEKLKSTNKEIKTASQDLEALHSSVRKVMAEILETPHEALVKHGLLDSLWRSLHLESVQATPVVSKSITSDTLEEITDIQTINKAISAWSFGAGVDPYVVQVALAAVLSHRVTLISGVNAERLAIALASTFAGDSAVRVSVGAAVFGIADLMNLPVTPVGATRLNHGLTLGEFLSQQEDGVMSAVILSGCNRAPPEVILPEFLLPFAGDTTMLSWSKANGQNSTLELSPRVKIIGTLIRGDTTYSIPQVISRQLGFLPADYIEFEDIPIPANSIPLPSRITPDLWNTLLAPCEIANIEGAITLLRKMDASLPPDMLKSILLTYVNLLGDEQRALAEAIAGLLLGRDTLPDFTQFQDVIEEPIHQRLSTLANSTAWKEASRYFKPEKE